MTRPGVFMKSRQQRFMPRSSHYLATWRAGDFHLLCRRRNELSRFGNQIELVDDD